MRQLLELVEVYFPAVSIHINFWPGHMQFASLGLLAACVRHVDVLWEGEIAARPRSHVLDFWAYDSHKFEQ